MLTENMAKVERIMHGAIDIHMHNWPEGDMERRQDVLEAAQRAKDAGMRAIVLKSKEYGTQPLAYLINKLVPDFTAFGALVLDEYVGGLNPSAVEVHLKMDCKVIWMPTWTSREHVTRNNLPVPRMGGLTVLDEGGKLKPEVNEILELTKTYGAMIQTGHLSFAEATAVSEETARLGIPTVSTHGGSWFSIEEQKTLADRGVFIEHINTGHLMGMGRTYDSTAEGMRAVGPERCIVATDGGQWNNPYPVEIYRSFVTALIRLQFTEEEIVVMTQRNPARVLGLD